MGRKVSIHRLKGLKGMQGFKAKYPGVSLGQLRKANILHAARNATRARRHVDLAVGTDAQVRGLQGACLARAMVYATDIYDREAPWGGWMQRDVSRSGPSLLPSPAGGGRSGAYGGGAHSAGALGMQPDRPGSRPAPTAAA